MKTEVMTIREMCDLFDVTPRTLRFYEAKELLAPIRQGQKRLFTRRCRARMTLILRGRRYGFNLEDIRQLLDLYGNGEGRVRQLDAALKMAKQQLLDLHARQVKLNQTIDELNIELRDMEHRLCAADAPAPDRTAA